MLSDKVIESIGLTIESYGRAAPDGVLMLWVEDLSCFTEIAILDALKRYRADRSNDRAPTIGQIIALIERVEEDGRPGAEEAWAIIKPLIGNEELSVIVTVEMQCAYPAGQALGQDEVGARMAFIESYRRLVAEARTNRVACKWILWAGDNKDLRADVVERGIRDGRLKINEMKQWLPAPVAKNLQLTDVLRENIDRSEQGLPALTAPEMEDRRTYGQKKLDEIKASLVAMQSEKRPSKSNDYATTFKIKRDECLSKIKELTAEEIRIHCKKPQPIGTKSIGLDGNPQQWEAA